MLALIMDWLPILGFFVTYKIAGIYYATAVLMFATATQILILKYYLNRKIEILNWGILVLVFTMGSLTLFFHNDNFIKWKPTILYLIFSAAFLITPIIKQNSLIEMMLASKIKLQKKAWKKINNFFVGFFLIMSILNTYVLINYSTEAWVNFKMFGTPLITILFILGISLYLTKEKQD